MSDEKPKMFESQFVCAINYVKLDAVIHILSELIEHPLISKQDMEETIIYFRTLHKEFSDEFDVETEEETEKHTHENVHMNEEIMGADEESDVKSDTPIDFKDIV